MASIYGNYSNYTRLRIDYEISQSTETNQTTISMKLYAERTKGSSQSNDTGAAYWNMSGTEEKNYMTFNWAANSLELYLGKSAIVITHDDDGKGAAQVNAYWYTGRTNSNYIPESISIIGTIELPTIARASNVFCTTANVTEPAIVTINSANSSFRHRVWVDFGNIIELVLKTEQAGGSFSWIIPESFYEEMPNNKTKSGKIYCRTYNLDGAEIGLKVSEFVVTTNEEKCTPSLRATLIDSKESTIHLTGDNTKLIKYESTAQITIEASARNGAKISSKKVNNTVVSGESILIQHIESDNFVVTVTDSRGYSNSLTLNPEIINYIPLSINATIKRRQPTTGEVDISFSGNYYNGSFGNEDNVLTIKWYYREKDKSDEKEWIYGGDLTPIFDGNTYSNGTTKISLGKIFDYQKAYEFHLEVEDKLTLLQPIYSNSVPKGIPTYNWGKDFFNINGDFKINETSVLPTLLYDNEEGIMSGNDKINDDISKYKMILVEIKGESVCTVSIFTEPSEKLLNCIIDAEKGTDWFVPVSITFKISGTTLTITKNVTMVLNATEQKYENDNTWYGAKITKIIGYENIMISSKAVDEKENTITNEEV